MSLQTYHARALVIRKTKLGEADLILTFVLEDGSQARAVARGARKPRNTFASRLELYAVADLLMARGRTLDIVQEARLVQSNERLRRDIEHAACAAPMAEVLDRVTQMGLEHPNLFALSIKALATLSCVTSSNAPLICAAHLLKTLALAGLQPSFSRCVHCGTVLKTPPMDYEVAFSFFDGGVVCPVCAKIKESRFLARSTLEWCNTLLFSVFEDISEMHIESSTALLLLRFCQEWIQTHVGSRLTSLHFLFSSALFT